MTQSIMHDIRLGVCQEKMFELIEKIQATLPGSDERKALEQEQKALQEYFDSHK